MTADDIKALGYEYPRLLPTGEWAALHRFMFTTGILVGIDEIGYRVRYCYASATDAYLAVTAWDGSGNPPGPWIVMKGETERRNPNVGNIGGIEVVAE